VVWGVSVLAPWRVLGAVYLHLRHYSLALALGFDVLVLYLTLGFRQFSHYFTDIRDALDRGDEIRGAPPAGRMAPPRRQRAAAHRAAAPRHRAFAAGRAPPCVRRVLLVRAVGRLGLGRPAPCCTGWPSSPAATGLSKQPRAGRDANERLHARSRSAASALIDHVPSRLTAFGFAVVGNFEEAINGWRRDAALWKHPNEGVILASAAGAVGVQLGGAGRAGVTPDRSRPSTAATPTTAAMGSTGRRCRRSRPPAERGRPGLALGGAVDAALALLSLANLIG
jgi:adenosylcobinamide-phosphate synthase